MTSEKLDKNWSKLLFKAALKYLQNPLSMFKFMSGRCQGNLCWEKNNELTGQNKSWQKNCPWMLPLSQAMTLNITNQDNRPFTGNPFPSATFQCQAWKADSPPLGDTTGLPVTQQYLILYFCRVSQAKCPISEVHWPGGQLFPHHDTRQHSEVLYAAVFHMRISIPPSSVQT